MGGSPVGGQTVGQTPYNSGGPTKGGQTGSNMSGADMQSASSTLLGGATPTASYSPFGGGQFQYGYNPASGFGNPSGAGQTPYYDPYFGSQWGSGGGGQWGGGQWGGGGSENPAPPPVDPAVPDPYYTGDPGNATGGGDPATGGPTTPSAGGGWNKGAMFQQFLNRYMQNGGQQNGGQQGNGYPPNYGSASNPTGQPPNYNTPAPNTGGEINYGLPGTDGPTTPTPVPVNTGRDIWVQKKYPANFFNGSRSADRDFRQATAPQGEWVTPGSPRYLQLQKEGSID